jgi:hypothetical protein
MRACRSPADIGLALAVRDLKVGGVVLEPHARALSRLTAAPVLNKKLRLESMIHPLVLSIGYCNSRQLRPSPRTIAA